MQRSRRLVAVVLRKVLGELQAVEEVIDSDPGVLELDSASRGWLFEMVLGILRYKGQLDLIIDSLAIKKKPSGNVRRLLYTGIYPLIAQRDPPVGKIVAETVEEIKSVEGRPVAGFANSILRRVSEQIPQWRGLENSSRLSLKDQARIACVEEGLLKQLVADYGNETSFAFFKDALARPTVWLSSTRAPFDPIQANEEWGARIESWPGFKEGHWFVQDVSSQALVRKCAEELVVTFGRSPEQITVLDLCAAPGGKTLGLAARGFNVIATDKNEKRLELVRQNLARTGLGGRVQALPYEQLVRDGQLVVDIPMDALWVDAPCSGLGVIKRHPEIKFNRTVEQLRALQKIQSDLLAMGLGWFKDSGKRPFLFYSVCSVFKSEGEAQVKKFAPSWSQLFWPMVEPHGDGFFGALIN